MTQRELADELPGKTEGKDISRWENGKHRPSPDTLAAIADLLGTTVADLHAGPVAGRETKGPTPDPFAVSQNGSTEAPRDLAELDERAQARHLAVMAELAEIRRLVEDQETPEQQDAHRAAGG